MHEIKVMVVDDSAFMRKVLGEMLKGHERIQVVAKARNGRDALEKLKRCRVDVITMDVEMPEMNGLQALEHIMKDHPLPVIMLSSLTRRGAYETIRALAIGAIDFIQKPSNLYNTDLYQLQKELIGKIEIAAGARLGTVQGLKSPHRVAAKKQMSGSALPKKLVAIGTSTGGPRALQEVLPEIPGDTGAAILVVQHMPAGFTRSLAERLDGLCSLKVKEGEDGEILKAGHAYIAPGGFHMRVFKESDGNYSINLNQDKSVSGHRPSVDALFESISGLDIKTAAVIMTGMGSDGALGMKILKEKTGCLTIAQDESTSVVFGMPKSAIKLGVVDRVVPLGNIGREILKFLEVK